MGWCTLKMGVDGLGSQQNAALILDGLSLLAKEQTCESGLAWPLQALWPPPCRRRIIFQRLPG